MSRVYVDVFSLEVPKGTPVEVAIHDEGNRIIAAHPNWDVVTISIANQNALDMSVNDGYVIAIAHRESRDSPETFPPEHPWESHIPDEHIATVEHADPTSIWGEHLRFCGYCGSRFGARTSRVLEPK